MNILTKRGVGESASRPVFVDDNIARPWTEFRMIKAAADPVVGHSYPSRASSSVRDSLDQVEKLDISHQSILWSSSCGLTP